MIKKPSFLERLTGNIHINQDEDDGFDERESFHDDMMDGDAAPQQIEDAWEEVADQIEEGELPIDMYQTPDAIIIRALVAGVNPDDLEISITRDMVTLKGHREEVQECSDEDYFHRELFWGSFTRTILLPEEVIIDEAEAEERHGLLEITLPKLDKDRSTKLSVKTSK